MAFVKWRSFELSALISAQREIHIVVYLKGPGSGTLWNGVFLQRLQQDHMALLFNRPNGNAELDILNARA